MRVPSTAFPCDEAETLAQGNAMRYRGAVARRLGHICLRPLEGALLLKRAEAVGPACFVNSALACAIALSKETFNP